MVYEKNCWELVAVMVDEISEIGVDDLDRFSITLFKIWAWQEDILGNLVIEDIVCGSFTTWTYVSLEFGGEYWNIAWGQYFFGIC